MNKQFLKKQVCGLSIMFVAALLPIRSAQAADELSDRYVNGYLNDPYTNEVAPDTKSVLSHGAARTSDELSDRYLNGYLYDPYTNEVAPDTKSVLSRSTGEPRQSNAKAIKPLS